MDTPLHRIVSTGERPVHSNNSTEQLLSMKDERIVSANSSPDAAVLGPPEDFKEKPESAESGELGTVHSSNNNASHEQNLLYGGFGNVATTLDRYSQYANADGLHVSPVIYNDNASLMFHSGYGFNPEIAYGQYSPVATPLPSIMVEGQLYSPHQIPFSPTYYPQAGLPNVPAIQMSPSELMTTESSAQNLLFGSGSGYFVHFDGSFGGGNASGNHGSSPLTSPAAYPQPIGILGSYEPNVQISQQGAFNGFGLISSSSPGGYPHGIPYQSSYFGGNELMRPSLDKGRREMYQDSIRISNDSHGIDRNRGPRASKVKGKGASELSYSSSNCKNNITGLQINLELYNRLDFVTEYESAKFFIIKSFSEDNIHKSIKYNVWASTPHGNKKLDVAYREANKTSGRFPVFLLFSVNASGQFCGVAEMVGPVDFEKDADYWQQDRWSGQFPIKWHIIKDVPNSRFRHLLLENNDNKPVTHSRDSQEVKLEQGIAMLKIFKEYDARTCILDDFEFYDVREKSLKESRARQQPSMMKDDSDLVAEESVNQISDSFGQALQLENIPKETLNHAGVISRADVSVSLASSPLNQTSDSFFVAVQSENRNKNISAAETGGEHQN